jgi:ribosomal protein L15E
MPYSTMKDDYKWYNSVEFNHRHHLTKEWPNVQEIMENDKRLRPYQDMKVGGKKPVATPQVAPIIDTTGKSNL